MISPIHFKNELVGWSATFVHVSDVGAMTPGGDSPDATEVFQEGIRFPGIKLVERGRLRRDVFDAFTHMTRQPDAVGLDLKCEIAANNVAKARVQAMYEQYGPEMMNAVSTEMIHYTETVLRSRLREITDGTWSETLTIEADGPRRLKLTLRKEGDQLTFDFTGTDKQVSKGINLPYHGTAGFCFGAILSSLAYDLPKNHGVLRPMTVIAPEGTLVNVKYPGPISMSTTSSGFGVGFLRELRVDANARDQREMAQRDRRAQREPQELPAFGSEPVWALQRFHQYGPRRSRRERRPDRQRLGSIRAEAI